VKALFQAGGE